MKYFQAESLFKGKREKKIFKSPTKNDALTMAKNKMPGIILKVTEIDAPLEDKLEEIKNNLANHFTKKKIKIDNFIASIRHLSVMTNAGISIHDAVKEVSHTTKDDYLKEIFSKVDEDLNSGLSLTESLMPYRAVLGDVSIAMIELGENTGNIAESLKKLSSILEQIRDNQAKFKKALRYPKMVSIAITIAFSILMVYVVPKFKQIFEKFNAELPLPTKILLGMEHAVSNYGLYILVGGVVVYLGMKYYYANNHEYKRNSDKIALKTYLIGKIIYYSSISRYLLVFTELVRAGIPIADALDTSIMTIDNTHIKEKLSMVKISVQRGISLTVAFEDTGLFESMIIQMIQAGEGSGTLDAMLEKATEYYDMKFQEIIDNISSYIEPILIGFIGGLVLLLALGIFMPMWDMAQAVKK